MLVLMCAIAFGGPLLVVCGVLLLATTGGYGLVQGDFARVFVTIALSLIALATLCAASTSALCRWCLERSAGRGVGLLTGLLLGVFFLSHDLTISLLAQAAMGRISVPSSGLVVFEFMTEAGLLFALAVVVCTLLVLVVELPLRWIQGRERLIPDGAFRTLRWVGAIIAIVASTTLLRDEGLLRLENTVKRTLG
jgi:hypothetical protein